MLLNGTLPACQYNVCFTHGPRRTSFDTSFAMPHSHQNVERPESIHIDPHVAWRPKSRLVAALLGIWLGAFGAHRFYLGYKRTAVLQVALTLVTGGAAGWWGMLEGWLILAGLFAQDARGSRMTHNNAVHWLAAAGSSVAFHSSVGIGALLVLQSSLVQLVPPPRGVNSIEITASIESADQSMAELQIQVTPPLEFADVPVRESQLLEAHPVVGVYRQTSREPIEAEPAEHEPSATPIATASPHDLSKQQPDDANQLASIDRSRLQPIERREIDVAANGERTPPLSTAPSPENKPQTNLTSAIATALAREQPTNNSSADKREQNESPAHSKPLPEPQPIERAEAAPPAQPTSQSVADNRRPIKRTEPNTTASQAGTAAPSMASNASAASRADSGVQTDSLPQRVSYPDPVYPPELLAQGITGLVKLRVRVGADGRVKSASVYSTSNYAAFDRAALDVITKWQFQPARRAGLPIEMEIAVPIRFVIETDE